MNIGSKNSSFLTIFGIFLCGLLLRVFFFLVSTENLPTTSDEALALLMAKAIREGERPLLFWGTPYQFPFESYLIAPFIDWLGNRAFDARLLPAVLACLSPLGFYLVLKKMFERPPLLAILLLVFPSAYLLTLQAAYFIPQYTATATWAWVLPFLVAPVLKSKKLSPLFCMGTGLLAGFALSNHLLSLPLVAAIALAICCGNSRINLLKNSALFIPSLLIGLVPYLAVYQQVKEAALTVHGSYPLMKGVARFFQPAMNENLKVVIGPELSLFPDYAHAGGYFVALSPLILGLFWLTLLAASLIRLRTVLNRGKWPALEMQDIFVLSTWLALFAFALSKRGIAGEYRYLLPVAWSFPFLVAVVLHSLSGKSRLFAGSVFGVLVLVNIVNSVQLIQKWKEPLFANSQDLPHIGKLKRYLTRRDIHHCFASFWHVNRITFETNERITCSPPFNDRFTDWPLPYRKKVEQAEKAAYVLNNSPFSRFKAKEFEAMLAHHRLTATTKQLHGLKVYHDFRYQDVEQSMLVSDGIAISPTAAKSLLDGIRSTTMHEAAAVIEFTFAEPVLLHRLRLFWDLDPEKSYNSFSIQLFKNNETVMQIADLAPIADRLYMRGSFPVFFSDNRQDIAFEVTEVESVRIASDTGTTKSLPLTEMEFYRAFSPVLD